VIKRFHAEAWKLSTRLPLCPTGVIRATVGSALMTQDSRSARRSSRIGLTHLSEQNWQKDAHTEREKPQRRRRSSNRADAAQFVGCSSRIQ
jgi:hypothetical protein